MDTVTYPATKVRDELARWVFSKVDITEQKEMAAAFQVKAVPIAIAVSGDGRMLKRIPNRRRVVIRSAHHARLRGPGQEPEMG